MLLEGMSAAASIAGALVSAYFGQRVFAAAKQQETTANVFIPLQNEIEEWAKPYQEFRPPFSDPNVDFDFGQLKHAFAWGRLKESERVLVRRVPKHLVSQIEEGEKVLEEILLLREGVLERAYKIWTHESRRLYSPLQSFPDGRLHSYLEVTLWGQSVHDNQLPPLAVLWWSNSNVEKYARAIVSQWPGATWDVKVYCGPTVVGGASMAAGLYEAVATDLQRDENAMRLKERVSRLKEIASSIGKDLDGEFDRTAAPRFWHW